MPLSPHPSIASIFLTAVALAPILVGTGCRNAMRAPDLDAVRAVDLVKHHEERRVGASAEGLQQPVRTARSPTGDRKAYAELLHTGVESQVFGIFVSDLSGQNRVKIAEAVNCFGLAWSPDGTKIAFSEGTRVYVADSDGRTRQLIHAGPGGPYPGASFNLQWMHDGRTLSFVQVENAHVRHLWNASRISVTLGASARHSETRK